MTIEEAETALVISLTDPEQADTPERIKAIDDYEKAVRGDFGECLKRTRKIIKQVVKEINV